MTSKTIEFFFPASSFYVDSEGEIYREPNMETIDLLKLKLITIEEGYKNFIFNGSDQDLEKIEKLLSSFSIEKNKEMFVSVMKQVFYKLNSLGMITSIKACVESELSFLDNIELE